MSIEVILIPIGLAAYRMLKEYRRTDLCAGCKQTRVTEVALLCRALERIGRGHHPRHVARQLPDQQEARSTFSSSKASFSVASTDPRTTRER